MNCGVFGQSLFEKSFAIGHIAWDVTSQFANVFSHLQVLFPDRSPDISSDTVYCRLAYWIPVFLQ
jgi:hypothetical protein